MIKSAILLIAFGSSTAAAAQAPPVQITPTNESGAARVGSFAVPMGAVSMTNGALSLSIPLITLPQRGGGSFTLAVQYDSNIWNPHVEKQQQSTQCGDPGDPHGPNAVHSGTDPSHVGASPQPNESCEGITDEFVSWQYENVGWGVGKLGWHLNIPSIKCLQ